MTNLTTGAAAAGRIAPTSDVDQSVLRIGRGADVATRPGTDAESEQTPARGYMAAWTSDTTHSGYEVPSKNKVKGTDQESDNNLRL